LLSPTAQEDPQNGRAPIASVKSAAISVRKRLRKKIETAGITLDVWDRMRADMEKPQEQREAEERERVRLMDFMAKPPGFQASFDAKHDDPGLRALNTMELKAIDNAGADAAERGQDRAENPYQIGTEGYQRWDTAFMRTKNEANVTELNGSEPRRRRTRRTTTEQPEAPPPAAA
jgi:hypothetical protein